MFLKKKTKKSTKNLYEHMPNGYLETIQRGLNGARRLSGRFSDGDGTKEEQLQRLQEELQSADAIVIGAGAGLSTSAGFTYSGERFEKWFSDFSEKYGFRDMYSGGFYKAKQQSTTSIGAFAPHGHW